MHDSLEDRLRRRELGLRGAGVTGHEGLVRRLKHAHTLGGLTSSVTSLAWSSDGERLVSACLDGSMKIWDVAGRNRGLHTLDSGHMGCVTCVRFLPASGNTKLVTCATDKQVRVADLQKGAIKSFTVHSAGVRAVAAYDADVILSGAEDGCIRRVDVRERGPAHNATRFTVEQFAARSLLVEQQQEQEQARSSWLYQSRQQQPVTVGISCLAVDPMAPHTFATGGHDSLVRVYDLRMLRGNASHGARAAPTWTHCYAPQHMARSPFGDHHLFPWRRPTTAITGLSYNHTGGRLLVSYANEDIYSFNTKEHARSHDSLQQLLASQRSSRQQQATSGHTSQRRARRNAFMLPMPGTGGGAFVELHIPLPIPGMDEPSELPPALMTAAPRDRQQQAGAAGPSGQGDRAARGGRAMQGVREVAIGGPRGGGQGGGARPSGRPAGIRGEGLGERRGGGRGSLAPTRTAAAALRDAQQSQAPAAEGEVAQAAGEAEVAEAREGLQHMRQVLDALAQLSRAMEQADEDEQQQQAQRPSAQGGLQIPRQVTPREAAAGMGLSNRGNTTNPRAAPASQPAPPTAHPSLLTGVTNGPLATLRSALTGHLAGPAAPGSVPSQTQGQQQGQPGSVAVASGSGAGLSGTGALASGAVAEADGLTWRGRALHPGSAEGVTGRRTRRGSNPAVAMALAPVAATEIQPQPDAGPPTGADIGEELSVLDGEQAYAGSAPSGAVGDQPAAWSDFLAHLQAHSGPGSHAAQGSAGIGPDTSPRPSGSSQRRQRQGDAASVGAGVDGGGGGEDAGGGGDGQEGDDSPAPKRQRLSEGGSFRRRGVLAALGNAAGQAARHVTGFLSRAANTLLRGGGSSGSPEGAAPNSSGAVASARAMATPMHGSRPDGHAAEDIDAAATMTAVDMDTAGLDSVAVATIDIAGMPSTMAIGDAEFVAELVADIDAEGADEQDALARQRQQQRAQQLHRQLQRARLPVPPSLLRYLPGSSGLQQQQQEEEEEEAGQPSQQLLQLQGHDQSAAGNLDISNSAAAVQDPSQLRGDLRGRRRGREWEIPGAASGGESDGYGVGAADAMMPQRQQESSPAGRQRSWLQGRRQAGIASPARMPVGLREDPAQMAGQPAAFHRQPEQPSYGDQQTADTRQARRAPAVDAVGREAAQQDASADVQGGAEAHPGSTVSSLFNTLFQLPFSPRPAQRQQRMQQREQRLDAGTAALDAGRRSGQASGHAGQGTNAAATRGVQYHPLRGPGRPLHPSLAHRSSLGQLSASMGPRAPSEQLGRLHAYGGRRPAANAAATNLTGPRNTGTRPAQQVSGPAGGPPSHPLSPDTDDSHIARIPSTHGSARAGQLRESRIADRTRSRHAAARATESGAPGCGDEEEGQASRGAQARAATLAALRRALAGSRPRPAGDNAGPRVHSNRPQPQQPQQAAGSVPPQAAAPGTSAAAAEPAAESTSHTNIGRRSRPSGSRPPTYTPPLPPSPRHTETHNRPATSTTGAIIIDENSESDSEQVTGQQASEPPGYERHFSGHCNKLAQQEVCWMGPHSEYVASGSDVGYIHVWDANTAELVMLLQGEAESPIATLQAHPFQMSLASHSLNSGESVVKLWQPGGDPIPPEAVTARSATAATEATAMASNPRWRSQQQNAVMGLLQPTANATANLLATMVAQVQSRARQAHQRRDTGAAGAAGPADGSDVGEEEEEEEGGAFGARGMAERRRQRRHGVGPGQGFAPGAGAGAAAGTEAGRQGPGEGEGDEDDDEDDDDAGYFQLNGTMQCPMQ